MNDTLLKVYQHLPAVLRSAVATLRGYQLRSWRYGSETNRLIAESRVRETWTAAQWQTWREERLSLILRRAATQVPFYRDQWTERRRRGDQAAVEYLENWPILERESLRSAGAALVSEDCSTRSLVHDFTSGTTGKSVSLWASRDTLRAHYALHEARNFGWNGVSRQDRWAILGGQLVTRVNATRPPFWVWNAALNQLYMSLFHLSPTFLPAYLDALRKYRITFLLGYTSGLYTLALESLRQGCRDWNIKAIITNAEHVSEHQRRTIEQAFGCRVCETYGMCENVAAATECAHGRLHLWPDAGIVEVLEDGQPVLPGETGDLVCTGLLNADMPLIRYRVGDRGALSASDAADSPCPCGRTLPTLASLEGRKDEVLFTPDGRRIGALNRVFKDNLHVREAQIIQETLHTIRVRYVPTPEYTSADGRQIVERIQLRMGQIQVELEAVDKIPRTERGKFRMVICNLPVADRPAPLVLGAI